MQSTKKKTVAITAPTGMLGSMVYNVLKDKYNLILIYRDEEKLKKLDEVYGDVKNHKTLLFDLSNIFEDYCNPQKESRKENIEKFIEEVGEIDAMINCAGIIIPHALKAPVNTFFINGALPHILSARYKSKLIHVTTDCVFDGEQGAPYDENSLKTPGDLYGLSKSLGEPSEQSLVLRTSIIGPELVGKSSLLEWVKGQEGGVIDGYTNHYWNGVTTKQLGVIFGTIIDNRSSFPQKGLYHLFSTAVTKYDLVNKIKNKYDLDIIIKPKNVKKVDRRLETVHGLKKQLNIPSLDVMIENL